MNRLAKLKAKFQENPTSCDFYEIKKILCGLGFSLTEAKGSHVKMNCDGEILIFSPHNGDIKSYQKQKALKACIKLNLLP